MSEPLAELDAPPPQPRDFFGRICSWLSDLGALVLFALMLLTCVDVFGRYLLNAPLNGGTELTELALSVIVFSALPVVTLTGGHVVVELLDLNMPAAAKVLAARVLDCLWALVLSGIGYGVWKLASRALRRREVSEYLQIPVAYVLYFTVFCLALGAVASLWRCLSPRR